MAMTIRQSLLLTLLAILCLIASGLYALSQYQMLGAGKLLLAELSRSPKPQMERIVVHQADEKVFLDLIKSSLVKSKSSVADNHWLMANHYNYPVDSIKVNKLVQQLALLRSLELKTSDPEKYPFLGVEDISLESAQGIKLSIEADIFKGGVILGNLAKLGSGQYVRIGEQSYLANSQITLPAKHQDWLKREIIALDELQIRSIAFSFNDKDSFEIERSLGSEQFRLAAVNEQKENLPKLKYSAIFASFSQLFTALNFIDVRPYTENRYIKQGDVSIKLFDGSVVKLNSTTEQGQYWLHLSLTNPAEENNYLLSKQKHWSYWQFQISAFDFAQLNRDLANYLQ
jgi:hypothetical protein